MSSVQSSDLVDREGPASPHVFLVCGGRWGGLCSPSGPDCRTPTRPSLPRAPPGSESWLPLTTAVWGGASSTKRGPSGSLRPPLNLPGSGDLPSAWAWGIRLLLGRQGCQDGAAAHLGSAVLPRECRGLFVPGSQRRTGGAPASASPRKLLPALVRSLPPSGPPSAAGGVFVAAAAPMKF